MNFKNYSAIAAVALLGLSTLAVAQIRKDTIMPAETLKWADAPIKGVKIASLWGDMNKGGAYGVMVKFEPGTTHPIHVHTHDVRLAVISGTFWHQPEGKAQTKMGPGSYLLTGGGSKHASGCMPESECVFYMTSKDKFDFITPPVATP